MPRIRFDENLAYSPEDLERRESTVLAAKLMMNAALTAPVAGGVPQIEGEIVWGREEQVRLSRKMEELAYDHEDNERLKNLFLTESVMARDADVILFIGNYRAVDHPFDVSCGGCGGKQNCAFLYENRKRTLHLIDSSDRRGRERRLVDGPLCVSRVVDLAFVVGSAVNMASRLLVDARPFFTMGIAGQRLGYCPNSSIVVAVPVATLSKNPFVDVSPDYHMLARDRIMTVLRQFPSFMRQVGADYRLGGTRRGTGEEKAGAKTYMDEIEQMKRRIAELTRRLREESKKAGEEGED